MGTKGTEPGSFSKILSSVIDKHLSTAGISRNRAAEEIKVSQPRVNRILNGSRPMYVDELYELATLLRTSPSSLSTEAEYRLRAQAEKELAEGRVAEYVEDIDPVQYVQETEAKLASITDFEIGLAAHGQKRDQLQFDEYAE